MTEQLPAASAPKIELDEEYVSKEGGYAFKPVPGHEVEEFYGLVTMLAPGADNETGPGITMIGGIYEATDTTEKLLEDFQQGLEGETTVTKPREVSVGGKKGIKADIEASWDDKEAFGRVVIVDVAPTQKFTMLGVYPDKNWEKEYGDLFEAVLGSVRFFEPVEDDADAMLDEPLPEMPPQAEGSVLRQWASSAKASSEYDNPDWSAQQATGPPDTPNCGDHPTAWAFEERFGIDWLEVGYDVPVIPTEVNIYESHMPTQVVKVELLDTFGTYHVIYTGTPKLTNCPFVLSIPVRGADYLAVGVKITVDQSQLEMPWDEIDAVELVGMAEGGVPQVATKPSPQPPTPGSSSSDQPFTIPTSNPEREASYKLTYSSQTVGYDGEEEGTNIEVNVHPDRIDLRFKGEMGRYLLLTLPPTLGERFTSGMVPFALTGRVPTSAGYYLRSIWYYSTDQGNVETRFNSDGTLSGVADFEAISPTTDVKLDIMITFNHVPLD